MEGDTFKVPDHVMVEADEVIGSVSPASEILINEAQTSEARTRTPKKRAYDFESVVATQYEISSKALEDMGILSDNPKNSRVEGLAIPKLDDIQDVLHEHYSDEAKAFIVDQSKKWSATPGNTPRILMTPKASRVTLGELADCFGRLGPEVNFGKSYPWDSLEFEQLESRTTEPESIASLGDYMITITMHETGDLDEVFKGYPEPVAGEFSVKSGYFSSITINPTEIDSKFKSTQIGAQENGGITLCQQNAADFITYTAVLRRLKALPQESSRKTLLTQLPEGVGEEPQNTKKRKRLFGTKLDLSEPISASKHIPLVFYESIDGQYSNVRTQSIKFDTAGQYQSRWGSFGIQLAVAR